MNNRERVKAILHYEDYDRMPVVHFGYWQETLEKWRDEGHLTPGEIEGVSDGNEQEKALSAKLGFDFNWFSVVRDKSDILSAIYPLFEKKVLETLEDGSRKVMNQYGVVELEVPGVRSIPNEYDHLLKDRKSWEELFLPRLQFSEDRFDADLMKAYASESETRTDPLGLFAGSLFGQLRNAMGLEGISYVQQDDEDLFDEMIHTVGALSFSVTQYLLSCRIEFDFGHFWEDICFNHGPLISPVVFAGKVGPWYKKITGLMADHGIDIVSLDSDGKIDALVPIWVENGVNTMFPIEVGTWQADLLPWRKQYGRSVRGVGGMDKRVFALDRRAVDEEVDRLKELEALGGFIPCVDHRIAPDAEWDNVRYYCDRMRSE
ncbi:MAG: hypothetical protein DRP71_08475 [Verrucomicrobia bacterium]|nr:MAG: hypothetical protein DRP71_08475 [Verrucomicrobiota bacterium]